MTNMSYCRFENTLTDLRDCAEQIAAMGGGDEFTEIPSFNHRERDARVRFCQELLSAADTLRSALGLDPSDDGEVSREMIEDWIERCEERARSERDDEELDEQLAQTHITEVRLVCDNTLQMKEATEIEPRGL